MDPLISAAGFVARCFLGLVDLALLFLPIDNRPDLSSRSASKAQVSKTRDRAKEEKKGE